MRQLTSTLLDAQKQSTVVPCVKVIATNTVNGVVRYDWSRLYTGSEDDGYHALTVPGDGSLIRTRITPHDDSRKLYRQRVAGPGPGSDFTTWTYMGQYNALVTEAASLGAEVSIFWINYSRQIQRTKSTDNGVSWGSPELIDYSPSTAVSGLAAAYKPNGDLAIFFADQNVLYVKKSVSGQWQTKSAWDKTTGDLSGVAVFYDNDWCLMVTGRDSSDNYKLWNLIYGDGGEVAAGSWSVLQELASAPDGGGFEYRQPFLDKTDTYRCFFIEEFTGSEAYSRPFWSYAVPDTSFLDGLWREPVPFNLSSAYGLAMAHDGNYGWLTAANGVWRAPLGSQNIELSDDVIHIRQEVGEKAGLLTVGLFNQDGKYAALGQSDLAILDVGCQVEFSPGCITGSGKECSSGPSYKLKSLEHINDNGFASLVLHANDGWGALGDWQARHQFRWNKTTADFSVKSILASVLGRVGLKLEVKSQSAVITGFFPDFTINPGDDGRTVITRLLSFVPDLLLIEGNTAYLVNPLATDGSVYSYGGEHVIREGHYYLAAMVKNRVQVEGEVDGTMILTEDFAWDEVDKMGDNLDQVGDKNLDTVAKAHDRGLAILRKGEIGSLEDRILVPVNCGQQLYDVIDITDALAGLDAAIRRVLGIVLVYQPRRGEYSHRLLLGAA